MTAGAVTPTALLHGGETCTASPKGACWAWNRCYSSGGVGVVAHVHWSAARHVLLPVVTGDTGVALPARGGCLIPRCTAYQDTSSERGTRWLQHTWCACSACAVAWAHSRRTPIPLDARRHAGSILVGGRARTCLTQRHTNICASWLLGIQSSVCLLCWRSTCAWWWDAPHQMQVLTTRRASPGPALRSGWRASR